MEMHIAMLTGY